MPDGTILAVPVRGTLTGNRGILHDATGQLGRARWRHHHWIACALSYKGWQRKVMSPGTWTELFFLDEAVALAAGHRPCALCRRSDYLAFRAAWGRAFGAVPSADGIDRVLHAARLCPDTRSHRPHEADAATLPEGTLIRQAEATLLLLGSDARPHAPGGYGPPLPRPAGRVTVLTPLPLVAVLAAGYRPRLHASAQQPLPPPLVNSDPGGPARKVRLS
jgi:hypothetical protein